tara:strand:- start:223 stop:720 length:498 start_codon:yes stop_codon:yes gene_type:complete
MNKEKVRELLTERVKSNMKKIFFENIANDISNSNFDSSFLILAEIRERICNLVPNRKDIFKELNENIDVDFYRKIHSNGAFNINIIHGIINYVISKLKEFDCLENEPLYDNWKKDIQNKIENKEDLDKLIPSFFKETMEHLDRIESHIMAFKKSDIYKFLSEKKQ